MDGGAGNDTLSALAPSMALTGGAGADRFIANGDAAVIAVTDYRAGEDSIDLRYLRTAPTDPAPDFRFETDGTTVRLFVDDVLRATLTGVSRFDPADVTLTAIDPA